MGRDTSKVQKARKTSSRSLAGHTIKAKRIKTSARGKTVRATRLKVK